VEVTARRLVAAPPGVEHVLGAAVRLGLMGYADNRPAGADPAKNRRVEVFVVRKGGIDGFQPVRRTAK